MRRSTVLIAAAVVWQGPAAAACPIGQTVEVDNDAQSSGYSEVKPENWVSHDVESCKGTYRYLSQYVGDGTRRGNAIWRPNITVAGNYSVRTGFRASVNRTNDADYMLHGDAGEVVKKSVDQTQGSGCTIETIGTVFCNAGGSCRLELDGDDGKSDAADVTTFELVSCDGDAGTPVSACDGIAAVAAYEVCEQSAKTCAGVFNDGSGCVAYCAAAGMVCVARFGGEPGCAKEPQTALGCDDQNGHASDWCECALPIGGAGGSAGASSDAGSSVPDAGGMPSNGGSTGGWSSGGNPAAIDARSSGSASAAGTDDESGGCGCSMRGSRVTSIGWLAALTLIALRRRLRHR